jgi:hypothetical protein
VGDRDEQHEREERPGASDRRGQACPFVDHPTPDGPLFVSIHPDEPLRDGAVMARDP